MLLFADNLKSFRIKTVNDMKRVQKIMDHPGYLDAMAAITVSDRKSAIIVEPTLNDEAG